MYGGRGEKTGNRVLNRATRTYRSPGSAIKPLSVYAPALEKGLITPASAMDDVPINFTYNKNGWPKNYYRNGSNPNGSGYKGRMSIVQAVEISNNTIPAQLIDMMTPEYSYSFLTANLGVTTIIKSMTTTSGNILSDIAGPAALSLGGLTKGMSVLELTAAYTPFANDGIYNKPRTYTQVLDSSGTVILENEPETRVAMTEKTAASVRNLMENVVYGKVGGATGTKARIDGIRTAGKTGTTSDDVDRWFVGFTPYYVGSVWFGYDKQQTVRNVSGNPALNLWKKVMDLVHEDLPDADFEEPEDFVSVSFCRDSGGIATEWCKADPRGNRVITQLMSAEDKPKNVCTIHQPVNVDSVTGMLATPYCPTENLKQVGLMQVSRSFPIGGIYVDDQQYTIPAPYVPPALPDDPIIGGITTPEEPAEGAAPAAATGAYNQYCTVHAHEVQQPEEPENPFPPEGGEWPPVGPGGDSEDEPGGDTPVTPPTETDPGTEPGGQGWENDPILGGTIPT